jgi:hypothetical protein
MVVAVLLVVVGPADPTTTIWLVDLFEGMMMHGLTNPKFNLTLRFFQ